MPVRAVTNVAIWGNHTATQFPDYEHAKIDGKPAPEVIKDQSWLKKSSSRPCSSAARR